MKKFNGVSYTANPCLHTFYKKTPKYLFIILSLVAIIFGCTFYQRVVGQVEFGNYQHNYNNPFEIRKLIYREPAKKLTDFYDVYWREDESKQIYRNISPFIKHKIEEKPAFELTDGACYRKTVFSNGRHIMSPYCTDGRLAEDNVKQSKVSGKASWYDFSLKGYPNYSKENYTAASRDYPRGTKLKVCRPDYTGTGFLSQCVVVRVNDWVENPKVIIDLSSKAFKELAPLHRGIIDVLVFKL